MTRQEHIHSPPGPAWKTSVRQPVAGMAVIEDTLFVATQEAGRGAQHSDLLALDLQSGDVRWRHHFEHALISGIAPLSLPISSQASGVVTTRGSDLLRGQGQMLAFDLDGDPVWAWRDEGERSYSAPAVYEARVLTTVGDGSLIVVSPEADGDTTARIPLQVNPALSAPAVWRHTVLIACRSPELVAVDLEGAVRWHFRGPDHQQAWLDQTPAVDKGVLFTVSRMGAIFALDAASGQLIWQQNVGDGRAPSPPVAVHGRVYVGTRRGVAALDGRNGQLRWMHSTSRPVSAAPLVVGTTVYVGGEDHQLWVLDAATGQVRWQFEMARRIKQAPILAEDLLVVVDRAGTIVALPLPAAQEAGTPEERPLHPQLVSRRKQAADREVDGLPLAAAPLWLELGELEKAALAYEEGGSWPEAAAVWQQLDRYGRRAAALEKQAEQLDEAPVDEEQKAAAWATAARAHAEIGQAEARRRCERRVAFHRRQPILVLEIKPGPLQVNAWSRLDYTIRNDGFGAARSVLVRVLDERFEGQGVHTQTMVTIPPDRSFQHWLEVLPQAQGTAVPMQLSIAYQDVNGTEHSVNRTFYLAVAGEETGSPAITGSELLATLRAPDGRDLAALRQKLVDYFSRSDLADLLFDLGLHPDDFGARVSTMARELIIYAVQHDRLDALIALCRQRRPGVEW